MPWFKGELGEDGPGVGTHRYPLPDLGMVAQPAPRSGVDKSGKGGWLMGTLLFRHLLRLIPAGPAESRLARMGAGTKIAGAKSSPKQGDGDVTRPVGDGPKGSTIPDRKRQKAKKHRIPG